VYRSANRRQRLHRHKSLRLYGKCRTDIGAAAES
jgi:hypothetical protein